MAEQIGDVIFKPSVEAIVDKMLDDFVVAISKMADEGFNKVHSKWSQGIGYNQAGEEIEWEATKQVNPILIDSGVLKRSLEIVLRDEGFDGFDLAVLSTDTSLYRQDENAKYKRHPAIISEWN